MIWEYKIIDIRGPSDLAQYVLNNYGQSGWELVAIDNQCAYLKRVLERR